MIVDNLEDLPDGWILTTLGDLGSWSSGGTPSRTESRYYNGDIPWIKTGDLSDGLLLEIEEKITSEGLKNSSAKIFPVNSLVVAMYGATIGRLGILKIPAATNQACGVLLAQGITDQLIQYLFYYLLSNRETLRKIGKGGAQPNISQTLLKEFPCPLPPLNEQRRIVSTIEQLTDQSNKARTALADVPKLIEQFRQSVLAAAFRGDLTADWREKNPDVEPASELLERIKIDRRKRWEEAELEKMRAQGKEPKDDKWKKRYSDPKLLEIDDLPDIPDTWTWVNADQVSWQVTDGEHNQPRYESQGYPMLTAKHVRDGYVDMSVVQLIAEDSFKKARFRCAPEENDLLIVSVGATTGRAAIVNGCDPFALVRSVLLVKTLIPSQFILNWIRSRWCQLWIAKASGSTAQAHLYINDTKIMPVPLPPEKELEEIIWIVKVMFDKFDSLSILLTDNFEELNRLDRSILAKAFRGELVPQDPNDEPAAVLLERIRAEREQTSTPKQHGKTTRKNSSKQLSIEGIE